MWDWNISVTSEGRVFEEGQIVNLRNCFFVGCNANLLLSPLSPSLSREGRG
jgi:hypothetical protein